jgi:hypothetical protein
MTFDVIDSSFLDAVTGGAERAKLPTQVKPVPSSSVPCTTGLPTIAAPPVRSSEPFRDINMMHGGDI